jgi:hypothetical protein
MEWLLLRRRKRKRIRKIRKTSPKGRKGFGYPT